MRIHDYTLPSFYSVPSENVGDLEERTLELEDAARHNLWLLALGILQTGPTDPDRRDFILLDAMNRLEEDMCINFVKAARTYGPLPAITDSHILEIATGRLFFDLAALQLEEGLIHPQAADNALRSAAANNHRNLVSLLLDAPFCSQIGKNLAAVAATEWGALDAVEELLERDAVSGNYVQNSFLDQMNGNAIAEPIFSRLLFITGRKGYWDIADKVASYMVDKLQMPLSRNDLVHLAAAAAGSGQADFLLEILNFLGDLTIYERQTLIQAAEKRGHSELLFLLDPWAKNAGCQETRHRRHHSC